MILDIHLSLQNSTQKSRDNLSWICSKWALSLAKFSFQLWLKVLVSQ